MIDTHCHLVDPQFTHDLEHVLRRALDAGLRYIINAGYDAPTSIKAVKMHEEAPWLLPAVGLHPNEAAEESIKEMGKIEELVENPSVCAVGETGLDFYRDSVSADAQKELFRKHIRCAQQRQLPLLIHTRNSMDDAIAVLKMESYFCGVFHCFSGSYEQACTVIEMGFYVGFGGILTLSKRMREIFAKLPLEKIILETDAPFLAPAGYRGKRNEPAYIYETLRTAASLCNMTPAAVERSTDANACRLFNIPEKKAA